VSGITPNTNTNTKKIIRGRGFGYFGIEGQHSGDGVSTTKTKPLNREVQELNNEANSFLNRPPPPLPRWKKMSESQIRYNDDSDKFFRTGGRRRKI
jgi:hypothetical protein